MNPPKNSAIRNLSQSHAKGQARPTAGTDPSSGGQSAIHKPFVVKSTTARDVTIAIIGGLALLAFVLWGILHMSQEVSGHSLLTGKILAKHFQPQKEEQLTIGKGGLDEKNIDGIYTMDVRTPDGHTYTVYVEKPAYQSHNPGDDLTFLPPPSRQP